MNEYADDVCVGRRGKVLDRINKIYKIKSAVCRNKEEFNYVFESLQKLSCYCVWPCANMPVLRWLNLSYEYWQGLHISHYGYWRGGSLAIA